MKQTKIFVGLLLTATALTFPALAHAQDSNASKVEKSDPGAWRLNTGINYSRGDYGDSQDTEVISVPIGVKYSRGGFNVRVSVPYVRISGPGSLIDTPQGRDFGEAGDDSFGRDNSGSNSGRGSSNSGRGSSNSGSGSSNSGSGVDDDFDENDDDDDDINDDGVVDLTGSPARNTRSGLGDVSVSLGYSFDFGNGFYTDVSSRIKLPTASRAKRMGTGKVDVTMGLDLAKEFGKASIYVGGRHKFTGKPAGSTLRDVWGVGAGASFAASRSVTLGLDYDWQQGSTPGRGASSEMTGWASFRLSPTVRMQAYASTGFNENSADLAGGLALSWRFQ